MKSIYTYWNFNWSAFIGIVFLCFLYAKYHNFTIGKWIKPFVIGLFLLLICFFSPLHLLSEQYLFSAHMVVHVVLLLVVGPLLIISLEMDTTGNNVITNLSGALYKRPFIGWIAGVGIMWFWHIPFVFNYCMMAAHTSAVLGFATHALESLSLITAGMLFSWSIVSPIKKCRLPALNGVAYLFTACIGCSLLGLLITFAPAGLYRHFLSMTDSYHLNSVIVEQWQINQATDQQIAGLIMWVPCCLLYVVYALYLLGRWFDEKDVVSKVV
ncbi:cytochrome c oxidase assembly protein [Segetibacter koreensis]|uniref:cytochrome c oxidase assembly protein n=1 Tax=Segetibacter koreensis TaxID=398037 RepID=UPI00037BE5ED|nr:cytochrome c oxidase assembly protein [Segetibacter koreensis]